MHSSILPYGYFNRQGSPLQKPNAKRLISPQKKSHSKIFSPYTPPKIKSTMDLNTASTIRPFNPQEYSQFVSFRPQSVPKLHYPDRLKDIREELNNEIFYSGKRAQLYGSTYPSAIKLVMAAVDETQQHQENLRKIERQLNQMDELGPMQRQQALVWMDKLREAEQSEYPRGYLQRDYPFDRHYEESRELREYEQQRELEKQREYEKWRESYGSRIQKQAKPGLIKGYQGERKWKNYMDY